MNDELSGLAFPFNLDPQTGGIAQSSGARKIRENLVHLLLSGIGERVMQREYGGGIRQLVHDPNNDALRAIVQHQIGKAIGKWEPRVLLQNVGVTQQEGTLMIEVQYVERQTQQLQTVTVPVSLGVV
jgi:phage baseplate assembly protein W